MSRFSIKIVFFTLSLLGVFCLPFLSYKLIPDTVYPSLKVSYSWPGASQYAIERNVTSKLEGSFASLNNLKNIFSRSYSGYGEVFISYDTSINIEQERFYVATLLRQIHSDLPKGVSYPSISYQRPNDSDIRLISYSMIPKVDAQDHRQFIDKILTPKITQNEAVNAIRFEGIPSYYYEIQYDLPLLNSLRITVDELKQCLDNALSNKNLGIVVDTKSNNQEEFLIMNSTIRSKKELDELVLKKIKTKIIRLKDVAKLSEKNNDPIHLYRINGQETISFSIIADRNANQITLASILKESIKQLEKEHTEYHFIVTHDATVHLKKELNSIFYRTLASLFFLLLFTIAIYRNFRYVVYLFISLFATLFISFIFFKIFNISIHIYSLMSIAISIGFVIDNAIITIDHYSRNRNKKVLLPIFAATITTITPLLLIAFLEDTVRLNLKDFSWALIVVLTSSLIVSFFLIPSLIPLQKRNEKKWSFKKLKNLFFFNQRYIAAIFFFRKFRVVISFILLFLFGLPLFLLPEYMSGESSFAKVYNRTIGNEYYKNEMRPTIDTYLGGVLKLFVENSNDGDFLGAPKRTSISVRIGTPFGSDIEYVNTICKKIETALYTNLSSGIDFFETTIYDKRSAEIEVFFLPNGASNLPYLLKGFLEKETLTISGIDFTVFGIGQPFGTSNGVHYDSSIIVTGYDYERLQEYTTWLSKKLQKHNRIENIVIQSERSWFSNYKKKYVVNTIDTRTNRLLNNFYNNYGIQELGNYTINGDKVPVRLFASLQKENSSYTVLSKQLNVNDSLFYKPSYDLQFDLKNIPDKIVKKNQEYQLALQYEFKGTNKHSDLVKKEIIDQAKAYFKAGFDVKNGDAWAFGSGDKKLYIPLLICVFIIFSICSILLESLKKSLLIVSTIPITFIGLFFSLYYLEIAFNSGVYGGLILLVGLLVNAAIFIINEYSNNIKKLGSIKSYIKAFNKKIVPIVITVISTIVGLIPFVISDDTSNFWYPFAVTICLGLIFSLVTIICVLPIFIIPNKKI